MPLKHLSVNGKNEDFCKEMVNSLKRTAPLIQNVTFTNKDYNTLKLNNMFIYCDPPYAYTKFPIKYRRDVKHYDVFNNEHFWDVMREWSKNNFVVISEITAPDDFIEIWHQDRYRSAAQSTKTRFSDKSKTASIYFFMLFLFSLFIFFFFTFYIFPFYAFSLLYMGDIFEQNAT